MMYSTLPRTLGLISTAVLTMRLLSTSGIMAACSAKQGDPNTAQSVYEFTVTDINGNDVCLDKYRGHPLIIVNVACKCGYTEGHYRELNQLYADYSESQGLRILAFPSNSFSQEPDSNADIAKFAAGKGVKFDMFAKTDVNGNNEHPLFTFLKKRQGGTLFDAIKWNFTKFVVDKNGQPVERFGPTTSPLEMLETLKKYFNNVKTEF